jgi:phage baseplate assembly protein gpV
MSTTPLSLGALTPWAAWGQYNQIAFIVQQLLSKVQTATLVRVDACTNEGDLSPVGFVNVTPLVNQIDGNGNPTPHITIYNVPYLRMQGGTNAIILDPQVGDIGLAVFTSRDISKVKSTKAQANPGSFRQYDFADGLYVGGMLNGIPQQYIRFSSAGVEVVSPGTITLTAPNISLDGDVTISKSLTVTEDVFAGPNAISLENHLHTSESPGTPTSAPLP